VSTTLPDPGRDFVRHTEQRTPMTFTHGLSEHPSLALDAIADLAEQLGPDSISAERAAKPVLASDADARQLTAGTIGDQVRRLAANDSWFTLLNIEQVPDYRALVDEILDAIARSAGRPPEELRRRMGFVFASSPGSVTAAHFDIEHSLLLQLQGNRTIGLGRFADEAEREHEVGRYWSGTSYGRLESMPVQDLKLPLSPGTAVYIPPYTPHWITNGDATSLSLTVTFFDRSNEDESLVQAFNSKISRLGLRPRPYGRHPYADRGKAALMRGYRAVRRRGDAQTSASR
jgi:hypothetical protein